MGIGLWIVIVLLISLIAFAYIKLEHHFHLIKMGFIALIVILLGISIYSTFTSDKVDISTPGGIMEGIYLYVGWLGGFIKEMWGIGVETTGRVISALNGT